MSNQDWLNQLQSELAQRRLPRQEVARLVAELSDHIADAMELRSAPGLSPAGMAASAFSSISKENHMSMDANVVEILGNPAAVAESAVREFRKRGLLRRSQLAKIGMFVLLPVPLLVLGAVAALFAIAGTMELCEWAGLFSPNQFDDPNVFANHLLLKVLLMLAVLVPAAGVSALFGRLAALTGRRWKWGLIACLIVAAVTGLSTYDVTLSDEPGKSQMMWGLGIGQYARLSQLWQFLIPAATGLLVLRRSKNSFRNEIV